MSWRCPWCKEINFDNVRCVNCGEYRPEDHLDSTDESSSPSLLDALPHTMYGGDVFNLLEMSSSGTSAVILPWRACLDGDMFEIILDG